MALHAYIASFEESDGFTCDHVLHGPSMSEVERTARIDARQRNATLVRVRPADSRGLRRREAERLGPAKVATLFFPAALLAVVVLLIQSSGTA